MIYDLIIIGSGPAGITAAIYAARKRMNFIVISGDIGGQAAWSSDIENYTGYQFVTGPELVKKFEEHMRANNIVVKESEQALEVKKTGELVRVKTSKGGYEAKTVIIASGAVSKALDVVGEKEFKNRGLTYCATCDGPLFAGLDVAVIGGGNSALDAVLQMMKIAKHVYVINNTSRLGGDEVMREKVESSDKVTIYNSVRVKAILGDKMVTGVAIERAGKPETLAVQGVFVEIGLMANSGLVGDLEKNERGEIKVNNRNETSVPGIFAAGDVTDIPEKQIVIAAGEGSKAAISAFKYLNKKK